jgi:branched-chain amino acid transport system permease protein
MNLKEINWKKYSLTGGIPLLILIFLGIWPYIGPTYYVTLFTYFLLYVAMATAWTMFSGTTGYISLASAAFFGIGIYAAALFGERMPLIFVIIIGGAVSFVLAFLVGAITLRLRGIYFAMFTFGLVVLFQQVLLYWEITVKNIRGYFVVIETNNTIYYYLFAICIATVGVAYWLRRSKFGLALQGIGENEEAAAHTGINVTMVKILTFALSSFFMGAAGVVMATKMTYIDPQIAFNPLMSFNPALMSIFGGIGNIYGPVMGSVLFSYIQEKLTTGGLKEYYMMIFGSILVLSILFLPNGILGFIQDFWKRIKGEKRAPTRG